MHSVKYGDTHNLVLTLASTLPDFLSTITKGLLKGRRAKTPGRTLATDADRSRLTAFAPSGRGLTKKAMSP